ncbi:hypothetical protein GGR55DRAFT_455528 [Xylaria sp. FL0064]|nr:hypothetical protein GGR55DRAFT_455528 [Xylaria sp. FL0064]
MESQDRQNLKPGTAELYVICPRDIEQLRIGPPGSNLYYVRPFRSFQYPRIRGRDYIRLLHLHSCDHDNPSLYGDLRVHKLDARCRYESISYSWGDHPKLTQGIPTDPECCGWMLYALTRRTQPRGLNKSPLWPTFTARQKPSKSSSHQAHHG